VEVHQVEPDVAAVTLWWGAEKEYKKLVLPKVPLLLASLIEDQAETAKPIMEKDGWREIGWYPTCHRSLDTGFKVFLFCKEQDVPPLPFLRRPTYYNGKPICFMDIPLHCSCLPYAKMPKLVTIQDQHRTMGVHRRTLKTPRKHLNNWHRFAVTPLASYWFWGLLPDETNRHKFE
jgi:hypothetical protein